MAALTRIEERQEANRRLGLKLLWLVGGSILFAVSLVPLYDVFCTVTGLNGKTQNTAAQSVAVVDENRWVKIEFTSSVMPGLSWNFHPQQNSIMVRPGKIETVLFEARNMTNQVVAGQAVPSVSPGSANNYLKKIECFCFVRQELQPGETKLMPLRFYVSPDLPEKVEAITLSYAFFSAVKKAEQGERAAF
ncbi:MAG: cytochrome c oxidase assembly protein [Betaproteobacteria bacterium HGW-Betaproteobacteria-8]|jgi:cytochrome c oxidase assembly protein subunit 11|nr:MAG: cytochrome c oxidase assembly protein [Betaproteobacteria bacterium HGW-Betaproteobacteria-8]PKO93432.1 MAG: cytochrome c oxidase assembly protein [Betaproteobacteria bacterium HGW-Betaproteobacteria-1]